MIAEFRERHGFTQERMADFFNVRARTVQRWEAAGPPPAIAQAVCFLDAILMALAERHNNAPRMRAILTKALGL